MSSIEVKVPALKHGEGEVILAEWFVESGQVIEKDTAICELETAKVSFDVVAEEAGIIRYELEEGTTLLEGEVLAVIEKQDA